MKLCQFWLGIVNVELEVGLSNPFVSEYPIAQWLNIPNIATLQNIARLNIPRWEEIFGLVRFQWGSAIVSSISFEGGLIKFEPGLNSLPLCLD